jgi:hypothetical protein
MKRIPLMVVLLLLIAGAGVAVVLMPWGKHGAGAATAAGKAPASVRSAGGGAGVSAGGTDGAALSGSQQILVADAWKALRADDLKAFVANLRAAGFPPAVVRAIVAATLDEQFAARRRQIMGDQPPPPYWKAGSQLALYSNPQMTALRQLAREEQDALKELLGPDSATSEWTHYFQQRMYGNLPSDKIDAIQHIQQDYNDLRSQIYGDAGGMLLPWDREKLAVLDQEQRADLAGALTPDELRQYDLYSSSTAQRLRSQLTYFNPSEQEFLAIYDLQSQFDQRYNPMTTGGLLTPDQMRQRQADQQQLQAQIKAALGDQRYVDYQQSTDLGFQTASRIASSLQLPTQNAAAVWTLQQDIQARATSIRTDRSLPPVQRTQALTALDAEANQQLTTLLTQPGADAYKQTAGGMWLRTLDTTPRRVSPAASSAPAAAGAAPSAKH